MQSQVESRTTQLVALAEHLMAHHTANRVPEFERYWRYYRNSQSPGTSRLGASGLAQAEGLPARFKQAAPAGDLPEVAVENDIAWRVHSMVDFMVGKPVQIVSTARDEGLRREIERALDRVWEASGGIALLQDMALLGHVYGHVDLALRWDLDLLRLGSDTGLRVEVVEPTRGAPILNPSDYRVLDGYVIGLSRTLNQIERGGPVRWLRGDREHLRRSNMLEILTATRRVVVEDGRISVDEGNPLGRTPIAHIQNISQPFRYEGLSEVEPLIPLQDELNTRLSDRASRVTMQSFKMYLAKGIEGAASMRIGPGRVWWTDNPDAAITSFGGDADSPSEREHIEDVRESMDKVSGVPPLASGVVRAKIGNLSSANALRITLMGVLSKTARKRVTYGRGISQISEMALAAMDLAGVLPTEPRDRGVRLIWPDPLPVEDEEGTRAAKTKLELGVPSERVLAELGYSTNDPGIT